MSERERYRAKKRRKGRHHDRPESKHGRLIDRIFGAHSMIPFRIEREIDHHDGILLDDADQQNDSDERNDAKLEMEYDENEQRPNTGGRNG